MIRFVLVLGLAAACGGKKEEPPTPATGSQPATGSAPATGSNVAAGSGSATGSGSGSAAAGSGSATTAAAPKDPDVPAPEDFEQDAATRITEKNIEAEVKALEKEIGEN